MLTAPIWLYQLWAFIVPGLLAKERKWALIFIGTATPLFLLGIATAYFVLPKAIAVLLGFTQQGVSNLQDINTFLSFMLRLMIVFGVAYLIPLLVLMLNIVGVVKASQLSKYRTLVIFGTFVFGAVATPSTDPFSMLALALPMSLLFLAAEVIAHILDRRKSRRVGETPSRHSVGGDRSTAGAHRVRRVRRVSRTDPTGRQPVIGQGSGPGAAAGRRRRHARRRPRAADSAQPGLRRGAGDGGGRGGGRGRRAGRDGRRRDDASRGQRLRGRPPGRDRRTTLGLVPAGTGNDLCLGLGLDPKDAEARRPGDRARPDAGRST